MSDVTVAPQGGVPSPVSETPINPNPVSSPNPVGPQAPDAPVGDIEGSKHRPESRRESIQRAFERANNPQPKTDRPAREAPKAAEAKPGHNRPPEETKAEKPHINLRKRPTDQARGEHGHFAQSKPDGKQLDMPLRAPNAQNARTGTPGHAQNAQPRPPAQQLPPQASYREPIQRMSERAKYDWAATPESVRADMHRMHGEFMKASNYYKADHEAMKSIRPYHEMAQKQGTTLDRALGNYVSMEQKLRADPIAGLDTIVNNLNLKTADGQRIGLRDIAYYVLNQSPEQLRSVQMGNQQQAAAHQIGALHQQVANLQNSLDRIQYQQQHNYTRAAVDQFALSHPRFDELGVLIEQELKLGFDIETAYRRAELLSPATQAAQTRTTSAQTRPADKSISGAPVTPSNGAARPRQASPSPRSAVENAMRRMNGY